VGAATPEQAAQRAALYARLHDHARIAQAFVAAHAQMKPVMQPPPGWLSKGGPQQKDREEFDRRAKEMLEIVRARYAQTDAGTWLRDGVVQLALARGSRAPTIVRPDGSEPMLPGRPVRIGRLDLIATAKEAGSVLEHDGFGQVVIPEDRLVGVHEMPGLLSSSGLAAVRAAVAAALAGDEDAALRLERALPLTHRELRTALARQPDAPGAPRLRLILALFDDLPMPATAAGPGQPRGSGR
jgi:hypothetical protein